MKNRTTRNRPSECSLTVHGNPAKENFVENKLLMILLHVAFFIETCLTVDNLIDILKSTLLVSRQSSVRSAVVLLQKHSLRALFKEIVVCRNVIYDERK